MVTCNVSSSYTRTSTDCGGSGRVVEAVVVLMLVRVLLVLLLVPVQLVPVVTCILRNLWCSSNSTRSFFVSADELSISKRSHSSSSVCIVEEGESVVEGID